MNVIGNYPHVGGLTGTPSDERDVAGKGLRRDGLSEVIAKAAAQAIVPRLPPVAGRHIYRRVPASRTK